MAEALAAANGFYRRSTAVLLLIVEVVAAVLNIGINLGPDFPGRSTISILLIVIAFGAVAILRPFRARKRD